MITGVHHIAIIVSSERSLEFYKLLGFYESFRKIRKDDAVVLMHGNGLELEVFIDPRHPVRESLEPVGLRHFALKVDRLEDEIKRLEKSGAEVGPIMNDWADVRFCYVKDYDGLPVELHE